MANKVTNSSVKNSVFDVNGSPITDSTQPVNKRTTVFSSNNGLDANSAKGVTQGDFGKDNERRLKGIQPLSSNTTTPSATFSGVVADGSNSKVQYHGGTALNTYFSVGDIALVNNVGFARVTAVEASGVTVNVDSTVSGYISSTDPLQVLVESELNDNRANQNGVMGYTSTILGVTNEAIKGGATSPNKDINRTNALRTRRVGTAIRNNQWSQISGQFTTEPSNDNADYTVSISGDKVASGINRVSYEFGSTIPTSTTHE